MMLPSISILLGLVSAKGLKWETYKPKDVNVKRYVVTTARVRESQSHETRVVRFSRGHPSSHVFLLPPAPGQGAKYWEGEVEKLGKVYGEDFVLYAVDLRGTTNGTPFFDEKDENWSTLDEDTKSQNDRLSISDLSVRGMAADLSRIVERVKEDPGFDGKIHLHARSFGALIALKALEDSGKTYASAVFESPLVPNSWTNIQNDSSFLMLCAKDDFCKRQFNGMDPLQVRNAVASIGSPGYNSCSTALVEALKKESIGRLPGDSSDWLRVQEFLQPFFQGKINVDGYHSAMLTLPFLSATYLCPDPGVYKREILPKMIKYVKEAKAPFSRYNTFDRETDVNHFANTYLTMYEIFNMGMEKEHPCQSSMPLGLASPCILYKFYRKYLKSFKSILSKHSHDHSLVKNSNTNLFFIGGALDLVTSFTATSEMFDKSTGKSKRLIKFKGLGHHPLGEGQCAKEIGSEILGRSGSSDTDACLTQINLAKLDWKMGKLDGVSSWWSGSMTAPPPPAPPKEDKSTDPPPISGWYWAVMVVGITAVLAVTAHVVYIIYTKRKAQSEESVA